MFAILAAMLAFGIPSLGQLPGNPENWCRGGFFTSESDLFRIGVVNGSKGSRAYFYNDDKEDCPSGRGCRGKAYLVPGDEVIVNREYRGYACGWFTNAAGKTTVGWLDARHLEFPERLIDASANAWSGEWYYAENSIELAPEGNGWLRVKGNAFWRGLGDNIHIGELDGRAAPEGGILEYSDGDDEYDCKATMRFLGSFLIVADNQKCGGANVSFSGVYSRNKPQINSR
ncbi:MAG TPA: hypothetical protein VK918_08885 [Pyrinomonadaceae bacterium]|nr:hypothetical protein [Pyrinomonadaceae bacterium]